MNRAKNCTQTAGFFFLKLRQFQKQASIGNAMSDARAITKTQTREPKHEGVQISDVREHPFEPTERVTINHSAQWIGSTVDMKHSGYEAQWIQTHLRGEVLAMQLAT